MDFADEKLNFEPSHLSDSDVIGDAYMYLVSTFASESGKKQESSLLHQKSQACWQN